MYIYLMDDPNRSYIPTYSWGGGTTGRKVSWFGQSNSTLPLSSRLAWGIYNPVPGRSANSHWSIADAEGNSIVLEYERGQAKIYENYVGVMTNDPSLWIMSDIYIYVNIYICIYIYMCVLFLCVGMDSQPSFNLGRVSRKSSIPWQMIASYQLS